MANPLTDAHLRNEIVSLIRDCGQAAHRQYRARDELIIETKSLQDFVSNADRETERAVISGLAPLLPDAHFLAEESAPTFTGDAPCWLIDPIDGTGNFIRGIPLYAVSVGLWADGRVPWGVIDLPALGETYVGGDEHPATKNDSPIACSAVSQLKDATVGLGYSRRVDDAPFGALTQKLLRAGIAPRLLGSAATGCALVAGGHLDAYIELHINAWDYGAACALIPAAGGRVHATLDARDIMRGGPFVGSAPGIFDALVHILEDVRTGA